MAAPTPLAPSVTRLRLVVRLHSENVQAGVLAAEAEGIRQDTGDRSVAGHVRHHVERDRGIRHMVVDRRRDAPVRDGEERRHGLHMARRPP